jgi:diguanylate cyclase (GGDEF)-like protein/PAS domain S-box-containing protein
MTELDKWKLRFERERKIRKESERLLEEKSLELYNINLVLQEQKDEFETIFETSVDGISILDIDGNLLFFNKAYQEMSGYTKDELLNKSCIELSNEEDKQRTKKAMQEAIRKGYIGNFEKTCIRKDKQLLYVNMSMALMPDKKRLLVSIKDITETKRKEKQIKDYVKLIDKNIIVSSTDLDGNITYVSEAFCKVSGFTKDELIGHEHRIVKHSDMPDKLFSDMWETIVEDGEWIGEIKNKRKDGDYFWIQASISPVYDEFNKKIGYTAIRQDITDKKIIEEISITDALTGIYNRRHFNNVLPDVINDSKRDNKLVSFVIIDIDHFKQYNDTYGHQMGDEVLKKVAEAIKKSLRRAYDYCFRLGGEEFGVIFKTDSKEKAIDFTNNIRQNIENLNIEHRGNSASPYVTASMGLICVEARKISTDDQLYKEADDLLYIAKKSGRNKVVFN